MDKWQYKTLKFETTGFSGGKLDVNEFDNTINSLGEDGWELTSCFDTNCYQGQSRYVIAVFKRKM